MPDEISPDPEVEFSPLCQPVTRDGVTIRVAIYRVPDIDDRWSLEVIGEDETSTVWERLFNTDSDAWAAFDRALESEGIRALTETFH